MYARINLYTLKPGTADDVIRRVREEQVPLMWGQPGFVAYELIRTGADTAITISHWESEEQGVAALRTTGAWVRETIAGAVADSAMHAGTVAID